MKRLPLIGLLLAGTALAQSGPAFQALQLEQQGRSAEAEQIWQGVLQ